MFDVNAEQQVDRVLSVDCSSNRRMYKMMVCEYTNVSAACLAMYCAAKPYGRINMPYHVSHVKIGPTDAVAQVRH